MTKMADMQGMRLGRVTILDRVTRTGGGVWWNCVCDCGKRFERQAATLRRSLVKCPEAVSCGCARLEVIRAKGRADTAYMLGQRFGRLLVLEWSGPARYGGGAIWLCRCDCGTEKAVYGNALRKGTTRSCGCLAAETTSVARGKSGPTLPASDPRFGLKGVVGGYIANAKARGHAWELSYEQVLDLIIKPCFYCGSPPGNSKISSSGKIKWYSGIDRKDNSLGYTHENVVPCCKICNLGKHTLPYEVYESWLRRVVAFRTSKGDSPTPETSPPAS